MLVSKQDFEVTSNNLKVIQNVIDFLDDLKNEPGSKLKEIVCQTAVDYFSAHFFHKLGLQLAWIKAISDLKEEGTFNQIDRLPSLQLDAGLTTAIRTFCE